METINQLLLALAIFYKILATQLLFNKIILLLLNWSKRVQVIVLIVMVPIGHNYIMLSPPNGFTWAWVGIELNTRQIKLVG